MKRKTFFILAIVLGLALSITTIALAKNFTYYVDGEITAINENPPSVDIMTDGGYTVTVSLPEGFTGTLAVGYTVFYEGIWEAGGFTAEHEVGFYLEGEITIVVGDTFSITTGAGQTVAVTLPEDLSEGLDVGAKVRIFGDWVDGVFVPTSVDGTPVGEGIIIDRKRGGINCDGGKDHPVAEKIAGMYGWEEDGGTANENADLPEDKEITPEKVMEQFCAGFGFGEIMHALILSNGDLVAAREILSMRANMGWGQIWKELGLTKNDKGSVPPPGQLKKPDDAANQPPGWANKPDKENKIRGWEKNQNKVKGPKNK